MRKTRASSSDRAREYRQAGHDDALIFALLLGLDKDYKNDKKAKKDVIDPSGDAHSLKSGKKKWQLFLYSRKRFIEDDGFQALNGIGSLLVHCIDAFPTRYEDYKGNEIVAKERLVTPMAEIKDRLQRKALLRAFLMKSIFNGGEVDYLTVLDEDKYHVFRNTDVVNAMGAVFTVENSGGDPSGQKVLFKYKNKNVGELEMRNDSRSHYQEVRFNMNKIPAIELLKQNIDGSKAFSDEIIVYGKAMKTFGNWQET